MRIRKNYESLIREYDGDKYSNLGTLNQPCGNIRLWSSAIDLHVQETQSKLKSIDYLEQGHLRHGEMILALKRYRKLLNKDLASIIRRGQMGTICELGSGLGQNLDEYVASGFNVLSLEISQNATVIQKKKFHGYPNIKFGSFNVFDNFSLLDEIPLGSIIFSSYVLSLNPKLSKELFVKIIDRRPISVVHYEPIYELHDTSLIYDRDVRDYILNNDYNRNLLNCLRILEGEMLIEITRIEKNFFGINPLFPCSIIEWRPK